MIKKKIQKTNVLRIIFIFFFVSEIILFAETNNSQNYPDIGWYVDSGNKLLSGEWGFENIIYSPIFSMIINLFHENKDYPILGFLFEILNLILIFVFSYFLSLLIDFKEIVYNKNIKIITLIPIAFLLANPFIIKYSLPYYSDSYSLIAGLIFAFRYSYNSLSLSFKEQLNFLYEFFGTFKYYILISFLLLLRYPIVIILLASLIIDGYSYIKEKFNRKIIFFLKYIFLISIFILIFLLSNNHISKFKLDTNHFLLIITFIMASLGFREAFAYDLSNPMNLLQVNKISDILVSNKIFISEQELQLSILLGVILLTISLISIGRIFYLNNKLTPPFFLSLILLISTELFIGFSHYRYSLMLIPSMLLSFSLKKKTFRLNE